MRRAFPPDNPSQRLDLRTPTRLLQHKCQIFRIVRAIAASKIIRSGSDARGPQELCVLIKGRQAWSVLLAPRIGAVEDWAFRASVDSEKASKCQKFF